MAAFEGRDFMQIASALALQIGDEGAQRTTLSRAYYACFHRARAYAQACGAAAPKDGSAHVAVRRFVATRDAEIESNLRRLHSWRKNADYDVPYPNGTLESDVQASLEIAEGVILAIDALPIRPIGAIQKD